jgi:hypothetical protein
MKPEKVDTFLFAQPNWMKMVCPENQVENLVLPDTHVLCHFRKKSLFKTILPAPFTPYTPYNGPVDDLINGFKEINFAEMYLHPAFPVADAVSTSDETVISFKHTRVLTELQLIEPFNGFKSSLQRQIRKAEKEWVVQPSKQVALFYSVLQETYQKRQNTFPFTEQSLEALIQYVEQTKCGIFLEAINQQQQTAAMALFVWDSYATYYLVGGMKAAFKQSGAMSLLLYKAILESKQHSKQFDFCGSTIPSIDRFFESFGAIKVPVTVVKKEGNLFFKTALKGFKILRKAKL